MSRRGPSWSAVAIAVGVLTAIAVASPALGGPSLKSLVKKEVAKQISKATGPAGANGANGVDGTARAYGLVTPDAVVGCSPNCSVTRSKGISNVTRFNTGDYCVHAPGIDGNQVTAVVSADFGFTSNPEGNGSAQTFLNCDGGGFEVKTERIPSSGAAAAVPADDVGFTIVIP